MVDSPGFLTHQRSAGHASVWTRFGRTAGATDLDATASGSVASSGFGGGLAAVAAWRATPRVQIALAASARRTLPEVDPDLAFWAARGYTAFPDAVPEAEPVDVARFRLGATSRVGAVRLGASAEVQGARAHVVHRGALAEAEGTATVARTEAAWARPGLRLRASATVRGALSGTEAFRSMWRRLPRLGAALDATLRPDDRLALWARLAARSGSRWDGFSGPELPAAVLLDLGLSKRAWGDRLCFSLAGRNVLGAEERTHPLGADLAPRLFVRLEARL